RDYHPLRSTIQDCSPIMHLYHLSSVRQNQPSCPTTPHTQRLPSITRAWFSLLRFRSPLLTEYLLLWVLRCFTSPRSHQPPYTFRRRQLHITAARFPHSDTLESTSVCRLPEAYRRL